MPLPKDSATYVYFKDFGGGRNKTVKVHVDDITFKRGKTKNGVPYFLLKAEDFNGNGYNLTKFASEEKFYKLKDGSSSKKSYRSTCNKKKRTACKKSKKCSYVKSKRTKSGRVKRKSYCRSKPKR